MPAPRLGDARGDRFTNGREKLSGLHERIALARGELLAVLKVADLAERQIADVTHRSGAYERCMHCLSPSLGSVQPVAGPSSHKIALVPDREDREPAISGGLS